MAECKGIDQSVRNALVKWDLPDEVALRLINVLENRTYRVEDRRGFRSILRLHRQGYHTRQTIESELGWMQALQIQGSIITPAIVDGRDRWAIQEIVPDTQSSPRYLVMFEYLDGVEPQFGENHEAMFETLGAMSARRHLHAISWRRPAGFQRLVWNLETVIGDNPVWGDWRNAPGMSCRAQQCLEQVPRLRDAWLRGYRRHRTLSADHEAEMSTLVMFRRLSLCAWLGAHLKVEIVQQLRADFVSNTVVLGKAYLRNQRQ